jgi:hypothetical protein
MRDVNIYELRTAANDMMNESEELLNCAIRQSVTFEDLASLDADALKAMASMKQAWDSCKTFNRVSVDATTAMYERQEKIYKKLGEINWKLGEINKKLDKH